MSQQTLPHIGEVRKFTGRLDAELLAPIRPWRFAQRSQSVVKIPKSEAPRRVRGGRAFSHRRSLKEDNLPGRHGQRH